MKRIVTIIGLLVSFLVRGQTTAELIKRAEEYYNEKKFKESLEIYNKARVEDSLNYHIYTGRGTVYYELK